MTSWVWPVTRVAPFRRSSAALLCTTTSSRWDEYSVVFPGRTAELVWLDPVVPHEIWLLEINEDRAAAAEFCSLQETLRALAQWTRLSECCALPFIYLKPPPPRFYTAPPSPCFAVHRNRKRRTPRAAGVASDRRGSPFVSALQLLTHTHTHTHTAHKPLWVSVLFGPSSPHIHVRHTGPGVRNSAATLPPLSLRPFVQ